MRSFICLMLVGSTAFSTPSTVGREAKKSDRDRIQGTWVSGAAEVDGKTVKGEEVTLILDGKQFTMLAGGKETYRGTFTLDEAKKPRRIDAKIRVDVFTADLIGIYELDGDTLRVCWGSPRATEFASRDPDHIFATYKRKPK